MSNQNLFDYLLQETDWTPLESDMQQIRDIVLEEAGFRWIPVSERLPDIKSYSMFYSDNIIVTSMTTDLDSIVDHSTKIGYYEYIGNLWRECGTGRVITVIAWMPLPKPYDPNP